VAGPSAKASVPAVIFDTDVLVWYFGGADRARRFLSAVPLPGRAVSAVTVMELVQGCRGAAETRQVKRFVLENVQQVMYPNEAICHRATDLLEAHAASHGLRVVDALIAATALDAGGALATANLRHYRIIAQLQLLPFRP
jgi:predicted nucleic acid-binding protein